MTNNRKQLIKYAIPIVILIIFVVVLVTSKEKDNLLMAIRTLSPIFIGLAIMLIIGFWLFEAYILYKLIRQSNTPLSFLNAFKITMVGQFFNGITPFASGGQPAQLYLLHKHLIPVGTGASVLTHKFILYQVALVLYSLFFVIVKVDFFIREIPQFAYLSLLGFAVHMLVIIGLLLVVYQHKFTIAFVTSISRFLKRHGYNKKSQNACKRLIKHIHHFHEQIRNARKRKSSWLHLGVLSFAQLTFLFAIPLVIAYGFNLTDISVINMIGAAAFISMVTAFIPIPGAALGAEGSFFLVYQIFFPSQLVVTALLLWRILTYYLPVFVGGLVVLSSKDKSYVDSSPA